MQSPDNNDHQEAETLQAPPELVAALRSLPKEPVFIPATVDEAVLRFAERHLTRPVGQRFSWLRFAPWLATAAAIVIVLLIVVPRPFSRTASTVSPKSLPARENPNSGHDIDILDAFALARQLKAGATPNPQLDVNGDGVVDERDVATLAAQAVKLQKGGHS